MKLPLWMFRAVTVFSVSLLLVACGQQQATPMSTATAAIDIGCFQKLQVKAATGRPQGSVQQAEAAARRNYNTPRQLQDGRLDALVATRLVTVLASGLLANGQDALKDQDVWLLTFSYIPTAPSADSRPWSAYIIVDASATTLEAGCQGPNSSK